MKNVSSILLLIGGVFLAHKIFASKKHPKGLLEKNIVSMHIGAWTEKGYPIRIVWSDGTTTNKICSEADALEYIDDAKQNGAKITEDSGAGTANITDDMPADKSIVSLKYRDLGNDMYYVKILFYDGTRREGKDDKDRFETYMRNAKYDNATIETF